MIFIATYPGELMANVRNVDVLICGAGGSGLTLAIELARRSISFQIIEKLPAPFEGSKGKGLQPRSLEIMEDLGVVDRIYAQGWAEFIIRRYGEDGKSFEDLLMQESSFRNPSEPYGSMIFIPQFSTEAILRERLLELGHSVYFGTELTAFEDQGESVRCELENGKGLTPIEARYLIACDGGKSFVRKTLGLSFEGNFLDAPPFLAADVEAEGVSRDVQHRWGTHDRLKTFSIGALPRTKLFSIQGALQDQDDKYLGKDGLTQLAQERTGNRDIKITKVTWAATFRFSARLVESYRRGRVFLCGDAAHVHPPTGGQGLNTSLQDAYNLGWKLASVLEGAPDSLLDSYESERRMVAKGMLELSIGIMKAAKIGRGRETHQLDLAYNESPISFRNSIEKRAIAAGNRAPDARLQAAGGRIRQVFELMRGTHFTLLCNGDFVGAEKFRGKGIRVFKVCEGEELWDEYLEFQTSYGLEPGEAVLIRPDGYIAALIASSDLSKIPEYLKLLGLG